MDLGEELGLERKGFALLMKEWSQGSGRLLDYICARSRCQESVRNIFKVTL